MCDDQEVVLLALEFENYGFEADGKVMIGLGTISFALRKEQE